MKKFAAVAGIYTGLDKTDTALAIFGPERAKKGWDDQDALASYAAFWSRQGKNLESAAERAVELVRPMAVKYEGFPVQQYENLVKQINDAMAQK